MRSISIERNLAVPMRDGVHLYANLFRPPAHGSYPAILSVTPYGKDKLPDRVAAFFMRLSGVKFGKLACSRLTGFEAPDPAHWVPQGYAVVQADVRGMHRSEGISGVLRLQDAEDYYDLIEWVAAQPWCDGRVGLMGVSYLCMSQWRVAALKPPHLSAMVPWEGVSDPYRELAFHGGIPETRFTSIWSRRLKFGRNRRFPAGEDFLTETKAHLLDDEFWASKRAVLEDIQVPALVCANWSDHGLHTRGSIEGFERISSKRKWLFTHGRRKWETFYSQEAREWQKQFLDHFLKDLDNGMDRVPMVRLEVRSAYYQQEVRAEQSWPLASVEPALLYLSANELSLEREPSASDGVVRYRSTCRKDRAAFSIRFDQALELIGSMRLKLWMSTSEGDDLDVFAVLRKLDSAGKEVFFPGFNGYERDGLAKGWLRASHRELDVSRCTPLRPWHAHARIQNLGAGDVVPLEIEIWPSATLFEAGSTLQVSIGGTDAARYPAFRHSRINNRGWHTIFTGGQYDSHIAIPLNRPDTK